jgi:hypothetical protein
MGTVRALGEGGEPFPSPATSGSAGIAPTMEMSMSDENDHVTRPQIAAVAILTLVLLASGILLAP